MSEEQAKRKTTSVDRQRTPPQKNVPPVIGSSCTWRDTELERFKVSVVRDVDPKTMIPLRFFEYDHLEGYKDCIDGFYSWAKCR
jgi:hypothetical protein